MMTEKVVILNSKDPDKTPHDKTSKKGVQNTNTVISLGISYLIHNNLFMHKFLEECQDFHTGHFIQSRVFGQNRKISIL